MSKPIFSIRPATEADLEELAVLINSAYRGDSSRRGWTTEADYLDGQRTHPTLLKSNIVAHQGRTLLCLRESALPGTNGYSSLPILACVSLETFTDGPVPAIYLGMLTVQPDLQARGIGRYLLQAAEQFAEAQGARKVMLGVIQIREALIAWYVRRGYRPTGKIKAFPYGSTDFGLPKRDDLHFVLFEKQLGREFHAEI